MICVLEVVPTVISLFNISLYSCMTKLSIVFLTVSILENENIENLAKLRLADIWQSERRRYQRHCRRSSLMWSLPNISFGNK